MRAIRAEIGRIEVGEVAVGDSALRRAPHTLAQVAGEEWDRPYTRADAAFPLEGMERDKYFAPVSRVDNAWGDRHPVFALTSSGVSDEGRSGQSKER